MSTTDQESGIVEEEVSSDDLFNAMWGSKSKTDLTPEDDDSDDDEDSGDEVKGADTPKDTDEVEAPPAKAAGTKPASTPEPPTRQARDPHEWIKSLPEEQRELAEALRHEALSDRGRVSALTRKINETATELARIKAHPPTTGSAEEKPAVAPTESEALSQLKSDYPELSKTLEAVMAERETSLKQEFDARLTPIQEGREADAKASAASQLEQKAAEIFDTENTGVYWKDVVHSEDFSAWLDTQPSFIQNTARTTEDPAEGLDVLAMYERAYQAAVGAIPEDDTGTDTSQGDKIKAQRSKRKVTTTSPDSKPAGSDSKDYSGDYDAMFKAMWG